MKRIIIFIFIIWCFCCYGSIAPVVLPDAFIGCRNMGIYQYYMMGLQTGPGNTIFIELDFSVDSNIRISEARQKDYDMPQVIGRWTIIGDTLFLYQNWEIFNYEPGRDDSFPNLNEKCPYIDIHQLFIGTHQRYVTDHTFPRNISVFKIENYGERIASLNSIDSIVGRPISKNQFPIINYGRPFHVINFGNNKLSEKTLKILQTNTIDTLTWKYKRAPRQDLFEVKEIICNGKEILGVWVKCGSISFHILNPTVYHQPAAAPFNANKEYSDWMVDARPGQWLRLQVARPNYGDSAIARSPYLGGWPDSVCVMDNEAYGYWFARPLRPYFSY